MMLAAERAVPYGALFRRDLEIEKNAALTENNGDFDALMNISETSQHALLWWSKHVTDAFAPIHRPISQFVITFCA